MEATVLLEKLRTIRAVAPNRVKGFPAQRILDDLIGFLDGTKPPKREEKNDIIAAAVHALRIVAQQGNADAQALLDAGALDSINPPVIPPHAATPNTAGGYVINSDGTRKTVDISAADRARFRQSHPRGR